MKVNGLGLASEEMNHVKNLLYVSKLRRGKSGLCLSLRVFGVVSGCSSWGRRASAGQNPQSDSLKKVLAFTKFAISFSKPLSLLLHSLQGCQMRVRYWIWLADHGFLCLF